MFTRTIIVILLAVVLKSCPLQAQTWQQRSDFPHKLFSPTQFVVGDHGYVGLGDSSSSANSTKIIKHFYRYDAQLDAWDLVADFPGIERRSPVSFVVGDNAYVGLGSLPFVIDSFCSDFFKYDPIANLWSPVASFPGTPRSGAAAFTIDSFAYVIGGVTRVLGQPTYFNDVWRYDPSSDTWTDLGEAPFDKRVSHSAFAINGKGYIEGGTYFNGTSSYQYPDLWSFDPQTGTWTQKIVAMGGVIGFTSPAVFVLNDIAYFCYGSKKFYSSYDPSTNTATKLTDFLGNDATRLGPTGFAVGGKGYFGLGSQYITNNPQISGRQSDIWEFTVPSATHDNPSLLGLTVAPNPVHDVLRVSGELVKAGAVRVQVYDAQGRVLREENWEIPAGNFTEMLDLRGCPVGSYFLAITTEHGIQTQVIVIE